MTTIRYQSSPGAAGGLFRTAYPGTTLREHYGLPVPAGGAREREGALTA